MEFENNQNARVCDVCHELPAAVEVTFLVDGERRNGAFLSGVPVSLWRSRAAGSTAASPVAPSAPLAFRDRVPGDRAARQPVSEPGPDSGRRRPRWTSSVVT